MYLVLYYNLMLLPQCRTKYYAKYIIAFLKFIICHSRFVFYKQWSADANNVVVYTL